MADRNPNLQRVLVEIRRLGPALRRAWGTEALDRVAAELARRFDFEEPLVRALIREELGEKSFEVPTLRRALRTRSELSAVGSEPDDGS